jgi:hypothetical protein
MAHEIDGYVDLMFTDEISNFLVIFALGIDEPFKAVP